MRTPFDDMTLLSADGLLRYVEAIELEREVVVVIEELRSEVEDEIKPFAIRSLERGYDRRLPSRILELYRAEATGLRDAALVRLPDVPVDEERRALESELESVLARFHEWLNTLAELLHAEPTGPLTTSAALAD